MKEGEYKTEDGNLYRGELLDGFPHGKGFLEYASGEKHKGVFRFGKPFDGTWKIEKTNGEIYEGEMKKE